MQFIVLSYIVSFTSMSCSSYIRIKYKGTCYMADSLSHQQFFAVEGSFTRLKWSARWDCCFHFNVTVIIRWLLSNNPIIISENYVSTICYYPFAAWSWCIAWHDIPICLLRGSKFRASINIYIYWNCWHGNYQKICTSFFFLSQSFKSCSRICCYLNLHTKLTFVQCIIKIG